MADPADIELIGYQQRDDDTSTEPSPDIREPAPEPETGTAVERWTKRLREADIARSVKDGVVKFCGVEDDEVEKKNKWQERAHRMSTNVMVRSRLRQMAPDALDGDEVDAPLLRGSEHMKPHKRDYHPTDRVDTWRIARRIHPRRKQPRKVGTKQLLIKMAYDGIKEALGPPRKSIQYHPTARSRSFAPADLKRYGQPDEEVRSHVISVSRQNQTQKPDDDQVDAGVPGRFVLDDLFFGNGTATSYYAPPAASPGLVSPKAQASGDQDTRDDYDEVDESGMHRPPEMVPPTKFREYNMDYRWVMKGGWLFREPMSHQAMTQALKKERMLEEEEDVEPGFMTRLSNNVKTALFDNADRWDAARNKVLLWCEKGLFGKCLDVEFDRYYKYTWQGDEYVPDKSDDYRPGFTLWLTFIQIIICITSLAVYGIAPIGYDVEVVSQLIIKPNLALEKESYLERENLWIGPRQADLVHLGAKYSPCMRVDTNIVEAIVLDRIRENQTACCINNDHSGCVQAPRDRCSATLSTWYKWTAAQPVERDIYRTSGSVCGQDPKFCRNPSSLGAFKWIDDITLWPICLEPLDAPDSELHMSCEVVGRPCCVGIQGECLITTREFCTFLRGYFHEEATLCSQIDCMDEVCGMLPFAKVGEPDQFYRLWTSLFLHAGILHLLITLVFNFLILWPMERLAGWMRVAVIYLASGMAGSLSSSIFLPYHVEAGPAGAQFGIIACHLVSIILFMDRPKWAILKLFGIILLLLLIGLLPMVDNYAHIFGFLFGFLVSFAILPFARFNKGNVNQKSQRLLAIGLCSVFALGLATMLIILFYVAPIYECSFCKYLNCIPFTSTFCETMEVTVRNFSSY